MCDIIERFRNDPHIQRIQDKHCISIHVAILALRGKIIAHAHNKIGTRSRGSGYSTCSIHAEKNVVKEIGDYSKIRGANMYVFRLGRGDKSDVLMNSKPCPECEIFLNKCISKYGLNKVYYSSG